MAVDEIGYILLTSFGSNLFYTGIALGSAGIQTHLRAIVLKISIAPPPNPLEIPIIDH